MQQPPARAPQTASDPANQGAQAGVGGQLLQAITNLTTELQNQNRHLAGLTTLCETSFILGIMIAQRMNFTPEELTHRLAGERETIKAQFLPSAGK
jgi:hypothetical protein